jgi:hypothetical protein
MKIVAVEVTSKGNIKYDDLVAKCAKHKDHLAAIMVWSLYAIPLLVGMISSRLSFGSTLDYVPVHKRSV